MTLTLKITPEQREDGLYLHIYRDGAEDFVGPIRPDQEYTAVLEELSGVTGPQPPSQAIRKRAALTERRLGVAMGARQQKASGALPGAKGDLRKRGEYRVEAKTSTRKSYPVTRAELNKIWSECGQGETPAFVIQFISPLTRQEEDTWVLIPFRHWNETHVHRRPGRTRGSGT